MTSSLQDRIAAILTGYGWPGLRGDVRGGVATAVVVLPEALALGVAVAATSGDDPGVGALAGLWGAVAVGFFAAVFGGSRGLISGPSVPMTVAMTAIVSQYSLAEAFTIVVMAGLIQIAMGALRLGRFIAYTPYSVISGVISGVGVIIVVLHIAPLFGSELVEGGLTKQFAALPDVLRDVEIEAFIVGAVTLLVAVFWPARIRQFVSPPLAALIVGAVIGVLLLSDAPVIGDVPSGLPSLDWPTFSGGFFLSALQPALIVALIGAFYGLLGAAITDSMTREVHDPNRELIGQGLGNTVSGLIGGLPGGANVPTSIVNVRAGGRSAVAGVVVAVLMLAVALGAGSLTAPIPQAVLAGILIKIGWDVIDWRFLLRVRRLPRGQVAVMAVTLIAMIFTDLVTAIAIGLILAGMANAARLERIELSDVISVPLLEGSMDDPFLARVGLVQLRGRFTVASSNALVRVITDDIEEHEVVIFDFTRTSEFDDSAVRVLEQLFHRAEESHTPSIVAGLRGAAADALESIGALDMIPNERRVETLDEARVLAQQLLPQDRSVEPAEDHPTTRRTTGTVGQGQFRKRERHRIRGAASTARAERFWAVFHGDSTCSGALHP